MVEDMGRLVIDSVIARRAAARARRESRKDHPRPARAPWHGRHDLLPMPRGVCPDCTAPLHVVRGSDALALFWIHGFGAVVRTTNVSCGCGYRRHWKTETITPRTVTA
jgi:hypothetical protein